ncbi:hypothetical protein COO60DRAFT_261109 [Scenedesmus sp. NREL 46B-D3]|nr:hypothetical protein COO60DRAFT_261109 [Scenedesmus sp. NREL 46B-D3]
MTCSRWHSSRRELRIWAQSPTMPLALLAYAGDHTYKCDAPGGTHAYAKCNTARPWVFYCQSGNIAATRALPCTCAPMQRIITQAIPPPTNKKPLSSHAQPTFFIQQQQSSDSCTCDGTHTWRAHTMRLASSNWTQCRVHGKTCWQPLTLQF